MGRPTKLTPERQAKLCDAISKGNHYVTACKLSSVGYATFRAWMVRGKRSSRGKYREFREAIEAAEAKAEADALEHWQAALPTSWQAARDFLARRFPERWSPDVAEIRKLIEELRKANERDRGGPADGPAPGTPPAGPAPAEPASP